MTTSPINRWPALSAVKGLLVIGTLLEVGFQFYIDSRHSVLHCQLALNFTLLVGIQFYNANFVCVEIWRYCLSYGIPVMSDGLGRKRVSLLRDAEYIWENQELLLLYIASSYLVLHYQMVILQAGLSEVVRSGFHTARILGTSLWCRLSTERSTNYLMLQSSPCLYTDSITS